MYDAFSHNQIFPLAISLCFLVPSLVLFFLKKHKISVLLLVIGTVAMAMFFANLNPFLNVWDEQFHALVAKNMMDNPFKPMLYENPILPYNYQHWHNNHIWVHKQPWFLWQMAFSYKVFGVNVLASRIPSAILYGIIPFFIYRIGKISLDVKAAYFGAFLFAFCMYPLELVAGIFPTDQNDISFIFYITASFWAWFEYKRTGKAYWIVLIGLFSGIAVLTKWLVGLLIYAAWGISLLIKKKEIFKWKRYIPIVIAFVISVFVFMPWQIYTNKVFPLETKYEKEYNREHIYTAIEGHGGNSWWHVDTLFDIYGKAALLLIPGLIFLFKRMKDKEHKTAIASAIAVVYIFFTYAATKMPAFTLIVAPLLFLGIGAMFSAAYESLQKKIKRNYLVSLIMGFIILFTANSFLNLQEVELTHTMKNPWLTNRINQIKKQKLIEDLPESINGKNYVLFNANIVPISNITVMFHTNHIAYFYMPSEEDIALVKKEGMEIAIWDLGNIPEVYLERDDITIIPTD
jgi:4-amino-4-deoxy-L-arabinose transferase-like glycosyltransferase